MIEKRIRNGICHAIYSYAKENNKNTKNYNKNIDYRISCIQMQTTCKDEKCQKLNEKKNIKI